MSMAMRQSSDMAKFKETLKAAKEVVILSGAGISAESGIPTFRGAGGYWRKYQASSLATPEAFRHSPSLVWEFYHYRREVAAKAQPNQGHIAIAYYESTHESEKKITVITQNVDGLHVRAGTKNLIELHGNLYKTRCTKCKEVLVNNDSPICEALAGRGAPDVNVVGSDIPVKSLPHCKKSDCGGLLRPHIVWFGESLNAAVLNKAETAMATCDICLVVGTSSVVYPAAMFAPKAAARGAVVAEFNLEPTPATSDFHYYFEGPCGTTLPKALFD
ncbi:PREDICTED: NAD-dependent protein deacylase sirtuin-5, mitochondrial-like isoform X2 [Papilio polytes]|uniref:NAD-dependent protein deacylase sirtuin-5, mitochondrial-like isoform X2 n=1 Tax=Papilio polytes TaxID=76194 RepID=UPI000675D955|nr:PREDICTED: NAD-dependent protein deacylase sirtuin-5, mitochondrial-like isoform X2 [Papilio polytes]